MKKEAENEIVRRKDIVNVGEKGNYITLNSECKRERERRKTEHIRDQGSSELVCGKNMNNRHE